MNYDQPTQLRHFYRTCVNVQLSIEICMSLFAVWVEQPRYSTKATVSHWPIRNSTKAIFYHNRGKNRDGLKCGEEEKEDEPTTNPKPIVNEFLFLLLASASINNFFFLEHFFLQFFSSIFCVILPIFVVIVTMAIVPVIFLTGQFHSDMPSFQ